jgi:hypothetical protein
MGKTHAVGGTIFPKSLPERLSMPMEHVIALQDNRFAWVFMMPAHGQQSWRLLEKTTVVQMAA